MGRGGWWWPSATGGFLPVMFGWKREKDRNRVLQIRVGPSEECKGRIEWNKLALFFASFISPPCANV